jgi:hypothetical protein
MLPPTEMPTLQSYFKKYFPDNNSEQGSNFTNRHHMARKGKKLNTSPQEIKQLCAIHLIMGCLNYSITSFYWQAGMRIPIIDNVMTYCLLL